MLKNRFIARQTIARFSTGDDGQVALTFALSMVPILMFIGAAMDYGYGTMKRTALQQATDSTVLAITPNAGNLTSAQLVTQANAMLALTAQDPNAALVGTPTLSNNNSRVCINSAIPVKTSFMSLAGINSMTVTAHACAQGGGGTFEVAMALDNTGSMGTVDSVTGKSKIQSAVLAAQNMVTSLFKGNTTSDSVKVSVVPFTSSVVAGTQYANASWVDTTGASSIAFENFPIAATDTWKPTSRFDMFNQVGVSWAGCFEERPQPYTLDDTAPSINVPDTLFEPLFAPDESGSQPNGYWSNNNYLSSQNGGICGTNPDGSNAKTLDNFGFTYKDGVTKAWNDGQSKLCKYKGQKANLSWGTPNWGCDATLPPIQLLTNSSTTLNATFTKMRASGTTNIVSGFMWAWRTISPNGPFVNATATPVKPYNYTSPNGIQNNKIIVFMTDGVNNWQPDTSSKDQGYYSAFGYYFNNRLGTLPVTIGGSTSNQKASASNQRQFLDAAFLQACTNAKAAGVMVYTVGFSISNDKIDTEGLNLLQNCATKPSMSYVATNGNDVVNIFGQIGSGLGAAYLVD